MSLPSAIGRQLAARRVAHCRPALPRSTLATAASRLPACAARCSRTFATVTAEEPAQQVQARFGQPTHETHPHLLQPGEVTPGCSAVEYAVRRAKLAAELPVGSIAVLTSATTKYRSWPVFYSFHQDPDFYYLTGFTEPDSACVIEKTGAARTGHHVFHMFVRGKDAHAELWDGARTGVQGAKGVFNADEAYDISELPGILPQLVARASKVYCEAGSERGGKSSSASSFQNFFSGPAERQPTTLASVLEAAQKRPLRLKPTMHKLRSFKSAAEIAVMRTAGRISGRVYTEAMGQHFDEEKDLAAFLDYGFRVGGCEKAAYVPVVAGGENALSIHYTRNDQVLRDGELVLVDAGGQYGGYVTDITRTWPVNGTFTAPQRDLYEAVLSVQRACVKLCRENAGYSLDAIHRESTEMLTRELAKLGFDVGGGAVVENVLYPHHVGHYIGVDLHDCPSYGRRAPLQAGQVVTIEPGVYVPDEERWPKHFRGMGIRIEDSVCVDKEGPIVLSTEAVKEVVDIEALRKD